MKKLFFILFAGVILVSCNSQAGGDSQDNVQSLTVEEMVQTPLDYEGQEVRFDAIISHVCTHSGDKMRVIQPDNDVYSIQVMLGDYMGQITTENEGELVTVNGTLHTEVINLDEVYDEHEDDEDHACETTEEAISLLEEHGVDPDIHPYIELHTIEQR
ncbi:MAG: hypothetical protein R6U62_00670 [Bacteroidales bacterium]